MRRQIWSVLGNSQRLDGGAMFGNAPKAMWSRWFEPDAENRIELACRCMLVREEHADGRARWVLCETGIGAFFDPEMRARFGVLESEHVLVRSLAALDLRPDDIDVVVLSHLHFDHAGGLLASWREGAEERLLFENARFVVGRAAWERACAPHPRDRASYIPALPELLRSSGRLELVEDATSEVLGEGWSFHRSDGHSPGMMLAELEGATGPLLFAADLIPGIPWLRRAITMGYDRYPELLIDEKARLLEALCERGGAVFFTHDPAVALARLTRDERGRITAGETMSTLQAWGA